MNIPLPILGSWFRYRDSSVLITTLAATQQVLLPDPSRWGILWQNGGTGLQFISFISGGGPSGGFYLLTTTLPLLLDFPHYGGLVQSAWYASSNPSGQQLNIWEILYQPPAMSEAGVDADEE